MYKTAEERIKQAHLGGTAQALCQFGFSAPVVFHTLMEKGASYEEAEGLTKEAFGMIAKGLGWAGKMLPSLGTRLGNFAARGGAAAASKGSQLALPGVKGVAQPAGSGFLNRAAQWGSTTANNMGKAFNTASQGMTTNPWGTVGSGAKNLALGATFGQGKGIAGGIGKGMLAYNVGSGFVGS